MANPVGSLWKTRDLVHLSVRHPPARRITLGPMSDRHISQHFETLAIHAGNTADPLTGAVVPGLRSVRCDDNAVDLIKTVAPQRIDNQRVDVT